MKKKRRKNKALAVILIAATLGGAVAGNAMAGPPSIDTDEALYVNLDYYGKPVDSSVVKGCSLNGQRAFTDYGTYTDVINMSNYAVPGVTEEGVAWELPEAVKDRFYYECRLENGQITLPWDFDISYKRNGVPTEAGELAGADGLVEIDVKCLPNSGAKDYYKNNMLLQVGTMVSMEDVNMVYAPGSQTQSLGTYKVIIFAAVPGEETTFHIEIGTSNFSSMGLIMLMIPGTLDQMKQIKEIKEVKDTVNGSTGEILDGMNEILGKLDNISGGMQVAQEGLEELQKARESFDASKGDIANGADSSLDSLEAVNERIGALAPDINENKEALNEINADVNAMVKIVRRSGDSFFELAGRLSDLEDELGNLQGKLNVRDRAAAEEQLKVIEEQLNQLDALLSSMGARDMDLDSLDETAAEGESQRLMDAVDEFKSSASGILDRLGPILGQEQVEDLRRQLDGIDAQRAGLDISQLITMLASKVKPILKSTEKLVEALRKLIHEDGLLDGVENGMDAAGELSSIMGEMDLLIEEVSRLNSTVNDNKAGFDQLLDDTAAVTKQINAGTDNVIQTLRSVQATVKENRGAVEKGTKQTLDGLIDILEKASETSGTAGRMQQANTDLKASIQDELDKVDSDTNFLELNAEEDLISFTSDKNPAPASIQVVLRTQEISEEDVNTNVVDIEPAEEEIGIWARIVNVFKKIWEAIAGIFS